MPDRNNKRFAAIVVVFMLLAAVLAGDGLGNTALWDDEAYVVTTARTLLATGRLSYWDGRNIYLPRNGTGFAGTLRPSLPPLDVLLCAASFKVFGDNNSTARLPFLLLAVGSVPLYASLIRRRSGTSTALLIYSLAALCLSCSFLLNARTCRYNIAALFLTTLTMWAYDRAASSKRWQWYILFCAAAVLLFYASYLVFAAFMCALAVTHVALRGRTTSKREWTMQGVSAVTIAALTIPYAVAYKVFAFTYTGRPMPWLPLHSTLIWWNWRDMNLLNVFPWVAAVLLATFALRDRAIRPPVAAWLLPLAAYVVVIGALSPQPAFDTHIADLRYLVPILPWMAALTGILLWRLHTVAPIAAVLAAVTLLGTNAATLLPPAATRLAPYTSSFRLLLPTYIGEVSHPYPTSTSRVVDFLTKEAKQDDKVVTVPDYFEAPLVAYLGNKIRVSGQLDRATTLVPEPLVRRLGAPLYRDEWFPNWIVVYGTPVGADETLAYYGRPYVSDGRTMRHEYVPVKHFDVYFAQTQRPELPWHRFGAPTEFDFERNGVTVYAGLPGR